ncbi:hypothetical protein PS627_00625 [Pseudomonas fluorescens]|uniref:hypothetical protein n=1 Tax=Pseudomonas fluorescens TaxID=294 RepID=UPI001250ECC8|nr:hypothetical protein [Pseudomonas fluorescens]CAG8863687.1 hypothetical protein PS627_00625 [Pseudomonas fluorescens]VVP70482.1 hypothetical protein PS910_00777 [Pseudomonas fluorescens]
MHDYTLKYLFTGEARTYHLALKQPELSPYEAALHLLQLHFGDAENGLVVPAADATAQEILEQAERVGLTQIEVFDNPPTD